MVGVSLTRALTLHVGLGVGGVTIVSGLCVRPTYSCDGWVELPTFVLVSRIHLAEQYRDNDHFLRTVSSSRYKTMVDGSLTRPSAECRFGCQWDYHRAWIVYSPIAFVDFSLVDLTFISLIFSS